MITAGAVPRSSPRRVRSFAALPSGSTGSSSARSTPSVGPTLDWSMPALAMTKPSLCSTISTFGRERTTRTDSDRISSTSRGSFCTSAASAMARCRGLDLGELDAAALGLGDDLLRQRQHVALLRLQPGARQALGDEGREVVACLDHRQAGDGQQLQLGRAAHPKRLRRRGRTCFAVELEEARLVGPGRVEHQVVEAQPDVVADLLDLLVGIVGHDPAAGGALERQGVGQPLHLDRILDRHLLLGRQRQRRPVPRVLQRALLVGVERHLDLDHVVVGRACGSPASAMPSATFGSSVSV